MPGAHSLRVAGTLCPPQQLLGWGHGVGEVCGERTYSVLGTRWVLLCPSPGPACAGQTSRDQPRSPPWLGRKVWALQLYVGWQE